MRLAVAIAACAGSISAFPAAASPQPEFLALEDLQAAAAERFSLRAKIRTYVRLVNPICPPRPPQSYAEAFGKSHEALKRLIDSFQDKQLILDVNIAYHDELAAVAAEQSVVDCAVNEISEKQARAQLTALQLAHQDMQVRGNAALRATGYEFDDAVQPDVRGKRKN